MRCQIVIALAVSGGVAWADAREDARREFADGQAADARSDYATAIEHYLRANDLVPHPFTTYNIAVDYERLGQLREAATWYARYLEQAPTTKDGSRIASLVQELAQRPGTLTVRTLPPGARVTIDDRDVGPAPVTQTVGGGQHHVRVDWGETRDVIIRYGEPADLTLTRVLQPGAPQQPTEAEKHHRPAGWLFGVAGGADMRGNGGILTSDLGIRYSIADLMFRTGEAHGFTGFDIVGRVALSGARLAPYITGGYVYAGGKGVAAGGGLRYDWMIYPRIGVSLMVESGLRYFGSGDMTTSAFVPLTATAELFLDTND